jgi:hypothetical protein
LPPAVAGLLREQGGVTRSLVDTVKNLATIVEVLAGAVLGHRRNPPDQHHYRVSADPDSTLTKIIFQGARPARWRAMVAWRRQPAWRTARGYAKSRSTTLTRRTTASSSQLLRPPT